MFVSIVGKVNFASVSKLVDLLSLNDQISVHTTFVLLVLLGIRLFIAVVLLSEELFHQCYVHVYR